MPEYDVYTSLMPDSIAGGGCPGTNEMLVPDLPFDFLQPQMRKQVTQVGYGGPFVIRSNPIGAIVDAIRGFCFPAPMEQVSSDGGEYADLSGYTMDPLGQAGGSYGPGGFGQGVPATPSMQCGSGTMWDASQMLCIPTPGAAAAPLAPADECAYPSLVIEGGKLAAAKATNNVAETCRIIARAQSCVAAAGANKTLAGQWMKLQQDAVKQANDQTKKQGCAAWIAAHPSPAGGTTPPPADTPSGMPPPAGTTPPPAGGSPGTDNSGMTGETPPPTNKPGSIFGFINTAGGNLTNTFNRVIENPRVMPPMPAMPNPGSLTEGNIYMLPTREPMGGSFDPSTAITGRPASPVRRSPVMRRAAPMLETPFRRRR